MFKRYVEKVERENPKRLKDIKPILEWWSFHLGHSVLADFNRSLISETLEVLTKKTVDRINKDTGIKEAIPITSSRVNRYLAVISHVCTVAVNEWEWLESNPLSKIKKLKEPRGRIRFLDQAEISELLDACKIAPYKHMYL